MYKPVTLKLGFCGQSYARVAERPEGRSATLYRRRRLPMGMTIQTLIRSLSCLVPNPIKFALTFIPVRITADMQFCRFLFESLFKTMMHFVVLLTIHESQLLEAVSARRRLLASFAFAFVVGFWNGWSSRHLCGELSGGEVMVRALAFDLCQSCKTPASVRWTRWLVAWESVSDV
jgi:hypothetical protein